MGSLLSSFMSLKMKIGAVGRGRLWNLKAAPQSAKAFVREVVVYGHRQPQQETPTLKNRVL
jgi:hypothetical protein